MKWQTFLLGLLLVLASCSDQAGIKVKNENPTSEITQLNAGIPLHQIEFTSSFLDADGMPIKVKAMVLLPNDFDTTAQPYPLRINIGGLCSGLDRAEKQWRDTTKYLGKTFAQYHKTEAPSIVTLYLDGQAVNGVEDCYWVNSQWYGPYKDALLKELIPIVEDEFNSGGKPENRFLYGASTGGWVAMNLFSRNKMFAGGVWAFAPDPFDFTSFQLIDIYKFKSAFTDEFGNELPSVRDHKTNSIKQTVREEIISEAWGDSTSSKKDKQWWIWNKAFSPKGKFLFDTIGRIDKSVATLWQDSFDLSHFYRNDSIFQEISGRVNGKIHVFCGERDNYFLNHSAKKFSALLDSLGLEHEFILDDIAGHRFMRNESPDTTIRGNYLPETEVKIHNEIKGLTNFRLGAVSKKGNTGLTFESDEAKDATIPISINKKLYLLHFKDGFASMPFETDRKGQLLWLEWQNYNKPQHTLYHISKKNDDCRLKHIPLWLSILPPLIAILLAFLFRQVIVSLFVGIWAGAFIAGGLRLDSIYYFIVSIWDTVSTYILKALNDSDHLSVILFSLLIGGMVAIISKNGGMAGVVQSISKFAKTSRSSQFLTWFAGIAIFFDDYANTLIVGNTMRGLTDKFRVSREKLAYLVDSTSAPMAAIAFVTTWIGVELGYIEDAIQLAGLPENHSAYAVFLESLKYSFYPILTLFVFIPFLIYTRRDYGNMLKAEERAKNSDEVIPNEIAVEKLEGESLQPEKETPKKWINAVLPVITLIAMTGLGLLTTGFNGALSELIMKVSGDSGQSWEDIWTALNNLPTVSENASFGEKIGYIISKSNSFNALLWGSLSGVIVAFLLSVSQRILSVKATMDALISGFRMMFEALTILVLAWALASTISDVKTASFIASALQDSVNPYLMPMLVFLISALIAFATGSSWSTMAIMYPLVVPGTWAVCQSQGIEPTIAYEILLNVIAVTLAASVMGDHCSPISDTTILSSLSSGCDHQEHVRTQLPYALTVGGVSIGCAGLAAILGGGWTILIVWFSSALLLVGIIHWLGKKGE